MTMQMPDFEIRYSVSGGYPVSEASLTLASDGPAEMFLDSSWALPGEELDQAGWFAGTLPREILADLGRLLAAADARENILRLHDAQTSRLPFDATVRLMRLVLGDQEYHLDFSSSGSDAWVAELEARLRQVMSALTRYPRQALKLEASLRQENEDLYPTFQVSVRGAQAATIVLMDSSAIPIQLCAASLSLVARIEFPGGGSAWNPQSMVQVPPEHWLNLIEQGSLPAQVRLAAPQAAIQLPLPALAHPSAETGLYFSGTLSLWLSGGEGDRRSLSLQTLHVPLAEVQAQ
jgi:hypothetical protein